MSDQRNTQETLQWYRSHETTSQLGYNPDGMCLQICHEARNIPAMYPSAFSAMVNTPVKYRIKKISNIRQGMVGFYDDPNDNNPFGHIVTFVGRVKNADPNNLDDILCRTNSVVSGRIVVVRGGYFKLHWGDSFQFAATWLNGEPIKDFLPKPPPPKPKHPAIVATLASIGEGIRNLRVAIEANKNHPRIVHALQRDLTKLIQIRMDLEERAKKGK